MLIIWHTKCPGRSTSPSNSNFTDSSSTLRAHISADPLSNGNFTDSCETHISFLLWQLHIWQTRSWQIYPPPQMVISQTPALLWKLIFGTTNTLWQTMYWQIYPLSYGNFTDFCSDSSYFIPTLTAPSFGRPGPDRSTSHPMVILQILASDSSPTLSWELIIWQTKSWQIYSYIKWRCVWDPPPSNGNFTDSCSNSSYFIPTLRAQHLTDQVLTELSPHHQMVTLTDSCEISQLIPTLRAQHLADQVLADLLPLIKWQFHRFLFYSESSYLSVQMCWLI